MTQERKGRKKPSKFSLILKHRSLKQLPNLDGFFIHLKKLDLEFEIAAKIRFVRIRHSTS